MIARTFEITVVGYERSMQTATQNRCVSIGVALSEAKFGWFNYFVLFISGIVQFAFLMESAAVTYTIPMSGCDIALTAGEKGMLGAACFMGTICSSHLWGFLADTTGRRRVILPTLIITFVLGVCASFANDFYTLASLRFLSGFFLTGASSTIYAYMGELHSNAAKDRAMMIASAICATACILLPMMAFLVINGDWQFHVPFINIGYKPWRLFFVVSSLPGLLSAIALLFLPESPKFVLNQGDSKAAFEIVQQINRWNNGKYEKLSFSAIQEDSESIENRAKNKKGLLNTIWNQTASIFVAPYLGSTILLCTVQMLINGTALGFYIFFIDILNRLSLNINDYFGDRIAMCDAIRMTSNTRSNASASDGIDQIQVDCVTKLELDTLEQGLAFEIAFAVSCAVSSMLINRVGKFGIFFFTMFVSGSCGIGCMLINIPFVQIVMFIVLFLCGLGTNVVNSSTVEIYPTQTRAMAVCISLMFARFGSVLGSSIGAILLETHCEYAFYLSGVTVLLAGFLAYFIPNIHRKAGIIAQ